MISRHRRIPGWPRKFGSARTDAGAIARVTTIAMSVIPAAPRTVFAFTLALSWSQCATGKVTSRVTGPARRRPLCRR
jgi:hypothetical protein